MSKIWYNNGELNKKFEEGSQPDGWSLGMVHKKYERRKPLRKSHIYNNGKIMKRFYEDEEIPVSWTKGGLPLSDEKRLERLEKSKATCIKKYGVENPMQSEVIRRRLEDSVMEKYGVRSVSQSEEIKQKKIQTSLKHYGVEYPWQSEEVRDAVKQTNLKRYGVENVFSSDEIKERIRKTNNRKYGCDWFTQSEGFSDKSKETNLRNLGVEYPMQSPEVREKSRISYLEHYGVENPMQSGVVKEKGRQTSLERYGTEYPMQSEEVRSKIRDTCLEKYGVEHISQSEEFKEKFKQTSLEHWGTEYPSQSEIIKEKTRQTCLERYGVEYASQSEEFQDRVKSTSRKKYGVDYHWQAREVKDAVNKTCQERYGVNWPCEIDYVRASSRGYSSKPNVELEIQLKICNVNFEREFRTGNYSYDFKVGNILIELDPFPFHNTLWSPKGDPKSPDYHQKKSRTAEAQGYQVIHIFDWDSKEKIIENILLSRETVYARKCDLREVSKAETDEFLNQNHLQNSCKNQDIRLGLYLNGEIISIMTFGKPRYNKNYQYELLRYCSSKNVIGGAEKLFTHFIREFDPESIISYCDRSKFRGDVYPKLGFTLLTGGKPSKHWYNPKTEQHFTDNLVRQRGVDQLLGTSYGKGTSNEELLIKHNFVPIYDCGQDTYIWRV